MASKDPATRVLAARIAAHSRWARERDRTEATRAARLASLDRFVKQVDPNLELDPVLREKLAESAKKEHYTRMALKSAASRRAKRGRARGAA